MMVQLEHCTARSRVLAVPPAMVKDTSGGCQNAVGLDPINEGVQPDVLQQGRACMPRQRLDVAKKEVYTAVITAQESKLQEFTADLQSESGRKNCFRIARQMAREGRDVISVCCI